MSKGNELEQIQNFLNDQLDETSRDAFEDRLLDDPEFRRVVEDQIALRNALKVSEDLIQDPGFVTSGTALSLVQTLFDAFRSPAWSAAMTVVAVVGVTLLVTSSPDNLQRVDDVVKLEQVRGEVDEREVTANRTLLQIDAYPTDSRPVSITLQRGADVVYFYKDVEATSDGYYNLVLTDQAPGLLTIVVQDGETSQKYSLLVVD